MREYSEEAFEKLCFVVKENKDEQSWFTDNGCGELWELWNAIDGNENSFRWLMQNHHPELAAVVDSMNGNSQAKKWLLMNRYRELAAFVDAAEGMQPAISFLLQQKEFGWVNFARAIFLKDKKKEKNFFWNILNFGNPFR
jgi:hypothetical protein